MSELNRTFYLLGFIHYSTCKQFRKHAPIQNPKCQMPLWALLGIGILLLTLMAQVGFAKPFTAADFEGTWYVRGLGVHGNSGVWGCGTFTFDETGRLAGSYTTSTGHSESPSGTLAVDNEGIIVALPDLGSTAASLHGVMTNRKDVIVFTHTGGDTSYKLNVLVKAGETFSKSDLQGTWVYHGLTTGDQPVHQDGWYYGSMIIDADGNATYSPIVDSKGSQGYVPEPATFNISEDGLVTLPAVPSFRGVMNLGKGMIVAVATMAPGQSSSVRGDNLLIMLRQAAGTYSVGDLSGTWYFHGLTSGPELDLRGWYYVSGLVHGPTFSWIANSFVSCRGHTVPEVSGTLGMTSNGIFTFAEIPSMHGMLDANKNVLVIIHTNTAGDYELIISVCRSAADFDLDGNVDFTDLAILADRWMN